MRRNKIAAVLAAVALLVTGCGSAGTPVDPAPVGTVQAPQPANVGGADKVSAGSGADDCDTRSLAPSPGIPSGSTMAAIRQRGRLIAGVDQTTYLFGFLNPANGNLEGFDIEMVKQIATAIFGSWEGHVQWTTIPSSQRENVLRTHAVDIVVRTYSITCARLKDVDFSATYYLAGQRVLAARNSGITGMADLGAKKVCATKTSTSLAAIQNAPSRPIPVSVNNWSDCLVMLQQGQVDAISTDDVILAGMAKQDPNLEVVGDRFTEEHYGVGIPKGQEDMVRFVNSVLESVRGDGVWQQNYNTWIAPVLGPAGPPPVSYQ
ncbi:glutamate ABC transporter substrate-binding protein [Amycolatopsis acidiphila]|uniref:Glutamate ABC transporter substrate-binding protein n=1 Tax=Amycolatopsis acidiphila TaxID=715473 RepID=A0A558AEG9_9PSEU|nr:glutamate ABC transporter substrate-binding protein [Amycolatopsis acidiphila]TVT22659.1 glutamate ABC transporter substrate-binding protein [Amycolatopsis acidiphila]UIJ59581.1 glutamate ABC transporter substrate-binding protein [Amycolatopsis acidiphila]GHG80742.1 ABC transporter substrate-binding protein [Amycolatopsis acidiphila]